MNRDVTKLLFFTFSKGVDKMLDWINVKELTQLGLDKSKLLGVMRLDWSGSRINEVCNQWFPEEQFWVLINDSKVTVDSLQKQINDLIFNHLDTFDKVVNRCEGEGYNHEETFKIQSDDFKFFVRLKPVSGEYSYIFSYIN